MTRAYGALAALCLNHLRLYFTVSLCLLFAAVAGQVNDSTKVKWNFRAHSSCSVTGQQNWYGNSDGAISLAGGTDLRYRKQHGTQFTDHRFRGEIGFIKPEKEAWTKSNDLLRLSFQWYYQQAPGWRTGFSARFATQWLSTWKPSLYDEKAKEWRGGFMNPFTFDFSYDFIRPLLQNSRLMVSLATISIAAIPRKLSRTKDDAAFIRTDHAYIRSRYGCSVQLVLDESFRDNSILLDHQSNLVMNALSADGLRADIQNRVAFKIYRYLQLRLDTRVLYDPDYSHKLQYRQEVLLGIFYDSGP